MSVKVLLLENVDKLGQIGEEATVAEGFARNYLIPRNLGVIIESPHAGRHGSTENQGIRRQLERKRVASLARLEAEIEVAQKLAKEISEQNLTIPAQAQEDGKLFGSVGAQQIVDALQELNFQVDRRQVALPDPIREVGMSNVDIHLHPDVIGTVKVWVVKMDA